MASTQADLLRSKTVNPHKNLNPNVKLKELVEQEIGISWHALGFGFFTSLSALESAAARPQFRHIHAPLLPLLSAKVMV
jgi:hypothetical protein